MKNKLYLILLFFFSVLTTSRAQNSPIELVFRIDVSVNAQTPSISLTWNTLPGVTSYNVMRKGRMDKQFVAIATGLSVNDTTFTDYNVVVGQPYEYCVRNQMSANKSGYVYAGINLPAQHEQGGILLLIDSTYISAATSELELFKTDLIKEGWKVYSEVIGRNELVPHVKQKIANVYNTPNTNLKGIILLGHIPVPYSGAIAPDMHTDHMGAWPADVFYGDMCTSQTDIWYDITLNAVSASDPRNFNIVGDGKFDANKISTSTAPKLFVGRIDVTNMATIDSNDVTLFKQYIIKNHNYRASIKKFRAKGLVDDNFGYFYGEAFATNGWRNMSSLVGKENVSAGDYFTKMKTNSYLWSYACGGGWYEGAAGVGSTTSFKTDKVECVFTMLYGSYFGDWDNANNFLRAPIASPSSTLVSIWAGRPNWFLHTMAFGEPIGYSMLNSVENNNTYYPLGVANGEVHQSIQGDPSLRMHMFEAPTNGEAFSLEYGSKIKLEWQASVDTSVLGYYVYRAANKNGTFNLISPNIVNDLSFIDTTPTNSMSTYMVRAVKLEQTPTGTFYNLSPGVLIESLSANAPLPVTVSKFDGYKNVDETNTLIWEVQDEKNIDFYAIERSTDQKNYEILEVVLPHANTQGIYTYEVIDAKPNEHNYYRLVSKDIDGELIYHDKVIYLKKANKPSKQLVLYPNPARNLIHVRLPRNENKNYVDFSIYNLFGQRLHAHSETLSNDSKEITFDISSYPRGNYILLYRNEEENETEYLKFAKME